MKKRVDSVALMRKAREKLSSEWADRPRSEEIRFLRDKHGAAARAKRSRAKAG